nr:zinc ABC transporter substrate-binding protein ZnuA [uncultured Cohaesibacter sp.]
MTEKSKHTLLAGISATLLAMSASITAYAAPKVATSIAPVYSITAAIMKDVATPQLLVDQATSPHVAKLQPSDAKALQDADLVIWIGPNLSPALEKPIETLPSKARILTLNKIEGLTELEVRTGGNWEKHVHDHDEEHDADHDHEAEHDHEHSHEAHDDHEHEGHDPHIWLDPENGLAMAKAITEALVELDSNNAAQYQANEQAFEKQITSEIEKIRQELAAIKDKPYIVFHDAYHYYENRFGISAAGSVMLQPGVSPGVARIKEIRAKLKDLNVVCIMAEPQFSDKILNTLIEGTDTKIGQLDPLGTNLELGPDLYENLMQYNASKLLDCLK